jgi:hypothetical protein
MSRLVKSKELSRIISIPVQSIRLLTREGKLPAYRIDGKNNLYDPEECIKIIKEKGLKNNINQGNMTPRTVTDTHKEVS